MPVRALVWLTEATWRACVDAARGWLPDGAQVTLLHVTDDEAAEVVHGAFAGLLGRGRPARDPSRQMAALDAAAAAELLDAAALRLGHPAEHVHRHGRTEHEVVRAAAAADLLVCGRDGQPDRIGPRSLSAATRFVVDHAPCQVLLVWPEPAPDLATIPPEPPHRPPHPSGPPHPPPGH
jgi:nucleotide-binding universal stress UspA family protein